MLFGVGRVRGLLGSVSKRVRHRGADGSQEREGARAGRARAAKEDAAREMNDASEAPFGVNSSVEEGWDILKISTMTGFYAGLTKHLGKSILAEACLVIKKAITFDIHSQRKGSLLPAVCGKRKRYIRCDRYNRPYIVKDHERRIIPLPHQTRRRMPLDRLWSRVALQKMQYRGKSSPKTQSYPISRLTQPHPLTKRTSACRCAHVKDLLPKPAASCEHRMMPASISCFLIF